MHVIYVTSCSLLWVSFFFVSLLSLKSCVLFSLSVCYSWIHVFVFLHQLLIPKFMCSFFLCQFVVPELHVSFFLCLLFLNSCVLFSLSVCYFWIYVLFFSLEKKTCLMPEIGHFLQDMGLNRGKTGSKEQFSKRLYPMMVI